MSKSALSQYINLWRNHSQDIDAHSAPALNAHRQAAADALEAAGRLPDKGDEGYARTSLEKMFAPDFGVNINRIDMPIDVAATFRCGVPNLSTLLAVVANDRFVPTSTLQANLPQGVKVKSLAQAARENPALIEKYYGSVAKIDTDVPTALNTMLAQDGVLMHIGRGIKVEKPLQIVNILSSAATPLLAARRILVVAEDDADVAILKCDHTSRGSEGCLSLEVVEICAEAGARVQWYDIEESDIKTSRCSRLWVSQKADSDVNICSATLTNGITRNDFFVDAQGHATSTRLSGMAIGSDTQHIDNCTLMLHHADRGHSNQLFKYVLDGHSTGAFGGTIEVAHGSRFVEAYQNNRNMLASTDARMHAKPALLIYNDDVKCSHGSATGQLDSQAVFYMQTRGIPEVTARRMLMQAFMIDVIDTISLEPLRDRMRHLVENRFAGAHTDCNQCSHI